MEPHFGLGYAPPPGDPTPDGEGRACAGTCLAVDPLEVDPLEVDPGPIGWNGGLAWPMRW